MLKFMRRLPTCLAAIFLIVQISGLADYAGGLLNSPVRGWLFSLALEAVVFGAAYWTRKSVTRKDGKEDQIDAFVKKNARLVLGVGLLVSALLNTAKTMGGLGPNATDFDKFAAAVFGMCPTLFAALLGILQGFIDRLPHVQGKPGQNTTIVRLRAIWENVLARLEQWSAGQGAPAVPAVPAQALHKCPHCGDMVPNLGSHVRWHCKKVKRQGVKP